MDERAKKVTKAVINPLTLAVSAAGTATFALSGLWWILPLTAGVAALVSATHYRSSSADAPTLPEPYRRREQALLALVTRNLDALERSGEAIRASLSEVPFQLEAVKGKVNELLTRQSRIDHFLAEKQASRLRHELERLEEALANARTPEAREKFSQAVENQRAEIDSRDGLKASRERIAAELAEIETALSSTLTKIVALESLHDEEMRESGAGITEALGEVLDTVDALEEALSEAFDPQGRRRTT